MNVDRDPLSSLDAAGRPTNLIDATKSWLAVVPASWRVSLTTAVLIVWLVLGGYGGDLFGGEGSPAALAGFKSPASPTATAEPPAAPTATVGQPTATPTRQATPRTTATPTAEPASLAVARNVTLTPGGSLPSFSSVAGGSAAAAKPPAGQTGGQASLAASGSQPTPTRTATPLLTATPILPTPTATPSRTPSPTATPMATPIVAASIGFAPTSAGVGQKVDAWISSKLPYTELRLDGPFAPHYVGVWQTPDGYTWMWQFTPDAVGQHLFMVTAENGRYLLGRTYLTVHAGTPTVTPTATTTPEATATPEDEPTPTPTPLSDGEPTATPTATPLPDGEPTPTPTATPTATFTPTPTYTPTATHTPAPTDTPTATPTKTKGKP